jgi:carboxypeptidase C (cathepsin A)
MAVWVTVLPPELFPDQALVRGRFYNRVEPILPGHTFNHSGIDRDRITLRNYFGGHMMYLYEPSLKALSVDVRTFIRQQGTR